jgi:hypothetical protein
VVVIRTNRCIISDKFGHDREKISENVCKRGEKVLAQCQTSHWYYNGITDITEYDACLCYIVGILIEEKSIGKVANNRCIMPTKI